MDMAGSQIAKKAKQMDIPYIVCPLGDISERNCKNPYLKRSLQQSMYQKAMYAKANLIVATTPMEKNYLEKKGWNKRIALIRYAATVILPTLNHDAKLAGDG